MMLLGSMTLSAQKYNELWLVGSAVPGGAQRLQKVSNDDYKYAGTLMAGELRVSTTRKAGKQTTYLAPVQPDANVVNHGLSWQPTADASSPTWQVVVTEDRYRLHVYPGSHQLRGEIVQPWGELFIGGGATASGWKEGKMQLMTRDIKNPFLWTWEGELKEHDGIEEPTSFKFQGQDRWYPKALHPYVQGTDILKDTRLRTGGSDTKWTLSADGIYRISIDLFNETVKAEKVK